MLVVDSLNKKVKYPLVELSATGYDRYFVYKGQIVEADYIAGSAKIEDLFAPPPTPGGKPASSGRKALGFECRKGQKHRVPLEAKSDLTEAIELMNKTEKKCEVTNELL